MKISDNNPPYVISFMNMKGGVGKTTLCVNLADALSKISDKHILLIDFDPQANSTQYILKAEQYNQLLQNGDTIYKIYKNLVEDKQNYSIVDGDLDNEEYEQWEPQEIIYNVNDKFSIVPGDLNMIKISQSTDSTLAMQLEQFIKNIKSAYDFIFIDCPPTQSIYIQSALMTSDYYILPVKPDYLSSLGMELFQHMVLKNNRTSINKVKCLGIVFTMVQKSDYYAETMKNIREKKKFTIFTNIMKHSSNVAKNSELHKLFLDTKGKKTEIKRLAKEFLDRINKM
ncbi:ParA family protein [Clostridium luticellarii]|uniref:Chromosome-partitioning ATPase Soj n=1 Tax=Clostridium luticellarii TaxID=1691940 RepID=A0A2T0BPX4_9CLOT|nr:ParA family protein [Clostridium luticellarii]PRR85938.1 Chromosome-partitioning ATPase Soj [Clostridium luticellarii]